MRILKRSDIKTFFKSKRVVIVGSAPSVLDNNGRHMNSFDVVVRVNNYKIKGYEKLVGSRTDVFYSFFGTSIKKTKTELIRDGVNMCMCKCPNEYCFEHNVPWDGPNRGSDFRWIYKNRRDFWFCPTYIPTKAHFMRYFRILGGHIPTTGFACILDIMDCKVKELYITGFDGFLSGKHNVTEKWRDKHPDDPICHVPHKEMAIIGGVSRDPYYKFITLDERLKEVIKEIPCVG